MKQYVLGIDIGSGSIKLTLLGRDGKIGAVAGCEYPTIYKRLGWAEQNPEEWCAAFHSAWGEMVRNAGICPEDIQAMFLDAATHTAVLMDDKGEPVCNAIHWTDQRSAEEAAYLNRYHLEEILEKTLNQPTTIWTLPQLMWMRTHRPEQWGRVRHLLFSKDYLRYRLTGEYGTDCIDAMGSMFYDAVRQEWSESLCSLAGIEREWLPKVGRPEDVAGYVTAKAAEEFGLARGTKVLMGTSDTVMEIVASGNVEVGHATVKLATAGRICVVADHYQASPYLFNYRHVVPGLWYPGTATSSCAASFRWFRDCIGRDSFDQLCEKAKGIPPGSEGLIFHPYLQGELTPYNDPSLKASYVGISSKHTTEHFTRATLEGISFSLRDCMDAINGSDMKMTRLRIIGGGAASGLWRQIVSDILGMPLEKTERDDSSFGSAMMAAVGAGWYEDIKEAIDTCVRVKSVTYPNPEHHRLYEEQFLRYRKIQQVLEEVYHNERRSFADRHSGNWIYSHSTDGQHPKDTGCPAGGCV